MTAKLQKSNTTQYHTAVTQQAKKNRAHIYEEVPRRLNECPSRYDDRPTCSSWECPPIRPKMDIFVTNSSQKIVIILYTVVLRAKK